MRLFKCQACSQVLYFENTGCEKCGHRLGYLPEQAVLSALEPDGDLWRPLAAPDQQMRFCANAEYDACNWMIPANTDQPETYCLCCRHNGTIPDLSVPANLFGWQSIQLAQHRLFYTLIALRLPLATRVEDPEHGLEFNVLADPPEPTGPRVMTGHDSGVITLALAEADDAERERRRVQMHEPYRTLLGHFRHEVGHHFWDLLVRDGGALEACRAVFGDDTADYAEALTTHYANGAPPDWLNNFVSAYASAHPWEDFAETWAHYLLIIDALEMARAFDVRVSPRIASADMSAEIDFDAYRTNDIHQIVDAWLPLTFAFNSLNRCLGEKDLYPFILSPTVIAKLGFIHDLIRNRLNQPAPAPSADRPASSVVVT